MKLRIVIGRFKSSDKWEPNQFRSNFTNFLVQQNLLNKIQHKKHIFTISQSPT